MNDDRLKSCFVTIMMMLSKKICNGNYSSIFPLCGSHIFTMVMEITQHFIPMIDNTIEAPGIIMPGALIVLSITGIKC